jgi:hypothetical protein
MPSPATLKAVNGRLLLQPRQQPHQEPKQQAKQKKEPEVICIDDDEETNPVAAETNASYTTPARPKTHRQTKNSSVAKETLDREETEDDPDKVEDGIIGMKVRTPNRLSSS